MKNIVFIDSEIGKEDLKIHDLGAINVNNQKLHSCNVQDFCNFVSNSDFFCGHNIVHHDAQYIRHLCPNNAVFVDTLYMSPILFPHKPYHKLVKDYKLQRIESNNPLIDAEMTKELFLDEINAFNELPHVLQRIYCALLFSSSEFQGFFRYIGYKPYYISEELIKDVLRDKICEHCSLQSFIDNNPVELAYAIAIINCNDRYSITPPWVLKNYPMVEYIIKCMRHTPCQQGCAYCTNQFGAKNQLKRYFGYDDFRTFNGERLQENAVNAAVRGESILAIFPTGGGKSLTFQLPALIAGETVHGLTVIISPLQSLMKDQVDNLKNKGIPDAVTINGMLSPIERREAIARVMSGVASILYISPESLRSRTIEKLLLSRNVVRFVIDEAHCFSAWGQDFRVDYQFIAKFIKNLQKKKNLNTPIPISCFTATAKKKVVTDICDYFKNELGIILDLYTTNATRKNLQYCVLYKDTENDKYSGMRDLIIEYNCPTIVYVSRTQMAENLAERLTSDGITALPYHGKMESAEKIKNQELFKKNDVKVMVATSAFGMGVDKSDVKLVIHYNISDSLENYMQESGRAGRDPNIDAKCYVLFSETDLDKHFMFANQNMLSMSEIQEVWKAIKDMTRFRRSICCSSYEIARQAGWNSGLKEMDTRVKAAISALEIAGYIERGHNTPKVFATSINVNNMIEVNDILAHTDLLDEDMKMHARRIATNFITNKVLADVVNDDAESHVDYLADVLGLELDQTISLVNTMKQLGILEDEQDMSAIIFGNDTHKKSKIILERFTKLENFLLTEIDSDKHYFDYKKLNDKAIKAGITQSTVQNIRTIIYYWTIKGYIKNIISVDDTSQIVSDCTYDQLKEKIARRHDICMFVINKFYSNIKDDTKNQWRIKFSLVGLFNEYILTRQNSMFDTKYVLDDMEDALLYLSKIKALTLEGGFLVSYNGMELKRLELDNRIKYKVDDYKSFNEFYKNKIQQIHIVGKYANLMVSNYDMALKFVNDYFNMDFKEFIRLYFKDEDIDDPITENMRKRIFDGLSIKQSDIIHDKDSQYIVIAAGPGSGKTKLLVHKLASLLTIEQVKHEQLLMLTFSRAAATEFKKRLMDLIQNPSLRIEIKTFHSYCFDLLGRVGDLDAVDNVVDYAATMIDNGEVEQGRIVKTVLVIDEAQDMDKESYHLIRALIKRNEEMRVIAVGDDDQNIYEFRGSSSDYFNNLVSDYHATKYEMTENYRSSKTIVDLSNEFISNVSHRMKNKDSIAHKKDNGKVEITKYSSKNLEEPIVDSLIRENNIGSTCVLTNTNEEALRVLGLLKKRGVKSKLIQSLDGFHLKNLVEIRTFLDYIENNVVDEYVSSKVWDDAKKTMCHKHSKSICLDTCLHILREFEITNPRIIYKTELDNFINESKYEDFCMCGENEIVVSTIHKTKGREFDNVYMMLNNVKWATDEDKRKIYVGMTRAKKNLYIHYNNDLFDNIHTDGVEWIIDNKQYDEPEELILQLSMHDVVLNNFAKCQYTISYLHAGKQLVAKDNGLYYAASGKEYPVLTFSNAFKTKLNMLRNKGYSINNASVSFLIKWLGKEAAKEVTIALADIDLSRHL